MKNRKLITLDVGNTSVTYGFYQGGRLKRFGSDLCPSIPKIVKKWNKGGLNNDSDVILSSVVPKNTRFLKSKLKGFKVWEAGKNLPIPLNHQYRPRKSLGIDRQVTLYGAKKLYKAPILVIDYGTAITFDYLSKQGHFKGGMIIPGPEISFQALLDRAALIPKKLRLPRKASSFLGQSTYDCMKSGILEGFGALTNGMIQKFQKRYGQNLKVVSTGGFAEHLKPYIETKHTYNPKLSLSGLYHLFYDNQ